ncbi:MAG: Eco57I restriction-modification methylase domain-containing protein [Cetobacterium sp.]|uniref:Eco57I restriction-modification methylase domain-containing protein n=1 Tax=Cetobacterium sp. TaxID=2071632 RepID=UPI003F2CBA37
MKKEFNPELLIENFRKEKFTNEDDIKVKFYSNIVKPILEEFNTEFKTEFTNEYRYLNGGRADAVFKNIVFEYKGYKFFNKQRYIEDALFGRNNNDSGLYEYIINGSEIEKRDSNQELIKKLTTNIGVGFDGEKFIFARFVEGMEETLIRFDKTSLKNNFNNLMLKLNFEYEVLGFELGIKKLILLLKQQEKIALNKKNLLELINPKREYVRDSINKIYKTLIEELDDIETPNNRVLTLYLEWNNVFGILFSEENQETEFNAVIPAIKEIYGLDKDEQINIKYYLFALQTYFNILLKLLINLFIKSLVNPSFSTETVLSRSQIINLFEGRNKQQQKFVSNFFEIHYYEWFTYSEKFDLDIVNSTIELINKFELASYVLKPESVQDVLQEVYMGLIPSELRHLMGEYFSPDWIVEFCLNKIEYEGDIEKRIVDPTCGSGAFLLQALKRVVKNKTDLKFEDIEKITNNIVGFDLNPISAVSAKANYIMTLFSSIYNDILNVIIEPVDIPIYIADSVLAPVVYSEENCGNVIAKTHVGEFILPKFDNYKDVSIFLDTLSKSINDEEDFEIFKVRIKKLIKAIEKEEIVRALYEKLYMLHRAGKDSFWPKILKNSFAPIMISEKFDYVVGNPPWISWKSMSKTYREGTGEVWRSYGIFEKSAYDKKTTHDDFGMAVTYVAVDQYLKNKGEMVFILPATFLKSTKGGEGFRKFEIIRNGQDIPFAVESVDNFSNIKLFSIGSSVIKFRKDVSMEYPLKNYCVWNYNLELKASEKNFDPHSKWKEVQQKIYKDILQARPVSDKEKQSAWLTLKNMEFADELLNSGAERYYSGRKGIEPAGAKGIYIIKEPKSLGNGLLKIVNDMSRQRRKDLLEKGENEGVVEEKYIYPMLGGRNIERWRVKSNEFIIVPHTKEHKYGIPEKILIEQSPKLFDWLTFYKKGLLASRIQNGKFFDKEKNPFYRLDNIGEYTYSPYKVLWKEQTGSMACVVIGSYYETIKNADTKIFSQDKLLMVDSKILYLSLEKREEAHYVCGILNAPIVREIIDGYAVSLNRGTDVLKYLAIPKYDANNKLHNDIYLISFEIHELIKEENQTNIEELEKKLDILVMKLFKK